MEGEPDRGLGVDQGLRVEERPTPGRWRVARESVGTSSKEMVGQGWGGVENCRRLASGNSVIISNN